MLITDALGQVAFQAFSELQNKLIAMMNIAFLIWNILVGRADIPQVPPWPHEWTVFSGKLHKLKSSLERSTKKYSGKMESFSVAFAHHLVMKRVVEK